MPLPYKIYGASDDVTFEYMDENGNVQTATVPNVAKVTADLKANGVTDSELASALQSYYKKTEVDSIKNSILSNFNNYYNKSEIDGKIKTVDSMMTKAEFEALAANRRDKYAGSGFIDFGSVYTSVQKISDGMYIELNKILMEIKLF